MPGILESARAKGKMIEDTMKAFGQEEKREEKKPPPDEPPKPEKRDG
jgi:hypothetical protein